MSDPVISGPSFLGLNQPGPPRKSGFSSRDSHLERSPQGIDYLLDDEEPESGGGAGKFVLLAIALALVLGLGYLRWRNGGFEWLNAGAKKNVNTVDNDHGAQQPPASAADNAVPNSTPAVGQSPAAVTAAPANDSNATNAAATSQPVPSAVPIAGAGTQAEVPQQANSTLGDQPLKGDSKTVASNTPAGTDNGATDSASEQRTAAAADGIKNSRSKPGNEDADNDEEAAPTKPAPAFAKPPAAKPVDNVLEAEKYIYGRGVLQDCDHGLRLLRPAANQGNAKAMTTLGALYSAGLCTPRDLPTAYRWFAITLRKEPNNNSVQTDLRKLWSEMTPPERQLAIKLSQ
ncbi:MAG TPA: hypothetical protein VI386_05320 [Candidatus Sulfotelmatobacter sp.]